jgi:hypothetical protein
MTAYGAVAQPGRADPCGDEFVDLICQDDELVRAEFEALVAACWDVAPPPARPPAPPRPARRPPGWPVVSASDLSPVPPPASPPLRWRWSRQRSPPDHRIAVS